MELRNRKQIPQLKPIRIKYINNNIKRSEPPVNYWTIDRRVPLALVAALLVQFDGFAWWESSVESRLNAKEQRLARVEAKA